MKKTILLFIACVAGLWLPQYACANSFQDITVGTHRIYAKSYCGQNDLLADFACPSAATSMPDADTLVLSGTTHIAHTIDCGEALLIFDKGGADADGIYPNGSAVTNWYYIRTAGEGTPLHIRIEASLALNCNLTVYNEYPSSDQAASPGFSTVYPGQYGICRANPGTTDTTVVCTTGKASIRFSKNIVTGARTCNYRILIWTSDTSEVFDITQSAITSTSAQVSWLDSSTATSWKVRYGTSAGNLTDSAVATLNPTTNRPTVSLVGLTPNTPYYFRVYNNAQTTDLLSGYCTRNDGYFITLGEQPAPIGCLGDFTDMNADNVICTYGHYDNPDEYYGIAQGRHTLITDVGAYDPIVSDSLLMIPTDATASVRLGNSSSGNEAESIIYRFRVDAEQNDMLLLRYAAVLQNPSGHSFAIQPRLSLQILRADGSEIDDNCYKTEFVASSAMTTGTVWHDHGVASGAHILWHDWSAVGVDLTPLDGEELYVKLTTRDCNESASNNGGAHYGYAYFTLECCKKAITYLGCGENASSTLVAPAGFSYEWHEVGSTATLSTERELSLPAVGTGTYECTMTFHGSSSVDCSFSMTVNPSDLMEIPHAMFDTPSNVAAGIPVTFDNTSFMSADDAGNNVLPVNNMASYSWNFGDGSTSTEENPTHVFPALMNDMAYTVTLVATTQGGCASVYQSTVLVSGTGVATSYNDLLSDACLVSDTARTWTNPMLDPSSPTVLLSTQTIPLVGDLNGDGHPNIVCMSAEHVSVINSSTNHRINNALAIFDGVTKERLTLSEPRMKNHSGAYVWADEFSVAPYGILRAKYLNTDIDTGLIIVATTRTGNSPSYYNGASNSYYLQAYDIHGVNIWTSSAPYGTDRSSTCREYPATVSFADFNGDGYPEVYVRNKIFDAATGILLAEVTPSSNEGDSWSHKCGSTNYYGILSAPFAADLSGDGLPELILGNEAYLIDIANRNGIDGNSATLFASHTPPTNYNNIPSDGHTQVADFNGDGFLDVLVSVRNTASTSANTYYYVWDVHNDMVSNAYRVENNNGGKSIPLIADIDNDGMMEVVAQHPRQNGNRLQALKYDPVSRTFTELWGRTHTTQVDDSWSNTLSLFDFNGDGINDLLFSGRSKWYVLSGVDGSVQAQSDNSEVTIMDYPVIADIDNDGSVEILTIDKASGETGTTVFNGRLHIYRSSGTPWSPGRSVWNQYMYNATNVNSDLTIPSSPVSNALTLTDPDGVDRQPFNNFLQQEALLDLYGRPSQYAADLTVNTGNGALFSDDSLHIDLYINNAGSATMVAPFGVTLYSDSYRGAVVSTVTVDTAIASGDMIDITLSIPAATVCGLGGSQLVVAVNDNGGGVAQHGNAGQQSECDTLNNTVLLTYDLSISESFDTTVSCTELFPYMWRGIYFEHDTTLVLNVPSAYGCDSTLTYVFHVDQCNYDSIQEVEACHSYLWPLDQTTYTASTIDPTVTPPSVILSGVGDAPDTVVTLLLTIHNGTNTGVTASACSSYVWTRPDQSTETYTESGSYPYYYTNADGCQDTIRLVLTIANTPHPPTVATVCDSYEWQRGDGTTQVYTSSSMELYAYTLDGCSRVDTLQLTVLNGTYDMTDVSICAPATYTWHRADGSSADYNAAGDYTYSYTNTAGCPSVDTLRLTVNNGTNTGFSEVACDSYVWTRPDQSAETYTESGSYPYYYTNADGCQDTIRLVLTIANTPHPPTVATVCDSYEWQRGDGTTQVYTSSSMELYAYTLDGCSRVDTLQLTVLNGTYDMTDVSICAPATYTWHRADGSSADYNAAGDYTYSYTNTAGCPSVDTLRLTVNNGTNTGFSEVACDSYVWTRPDQSTETYTASGSYPYYYTNADGCQDTIRLVLTIANTPHPPTVATVCDSYEWQRGDGTTQVYTSSSMELYAYTLDGCSRVDTLQLTVLNGTYDMTDVSICAPATYTWHRADGSSADYNAAGDYTYSYTNTAGCTSVDTLRLTINHGDSSTVSALACDSYVWTRPDQSTETYTASGSYPYYYTNADGCQDTIRLMLTIANTPHPPTVATVCDSYEWQRGDGTTQVYTSSSMELYAYTLDGCSRVDTLQLTVLNGTYDLTEASTCGTYTWQRIDGSSADYNEAGDYTYSYTNTAGCPSVDTLRLTVNHGDSSTVSALACDSYVWIRPDQSTADYAASGYYSYYYSDANGCVDTLTLLLTIIETSHLSINETVCESYEWLRSDGSAQIYTSSVTEIYRYTVAGCSSADTLQLTVLSDGRDNVTATVCDSLEWGGQWRTESGDYFYQYQVSVCTVTAELHLTVEHATHRYEQATACESYRWHLNGQTYTASGEYIAFQTSEAGCLDTVTLSLFVANQEPTLERVVACDYFEMDGHRYTENEMVTLFSGQGVLGCDSVSLLSIEIYPSYETHAEMQVCDSLVWHGIAYYTSEELHYNGLSVAGCDSTVTLSLTVNSSYEQWEEVDACERYEWFEYRNITESTDTLRHRYATVAGCDSVLRLDVHIYHSSSSTETVVSCGAYNWNGRVYANSGDYVYNTLTEHQCDSTATLHLTVWPQYHSRFYDTICEGETYHFGNETYNVAGEYTSTFQTAHGCDSTVVLELYQLLPPPTYIDASPLCNVERWLLTAEGYEPVSYTWTASRGASQLADVEHNRAVEFRATDTTVVTLYTDYIVGHSCPATTSVRLYPIHQVHADMVCHPDVLNAEQSHLTAMDASSGSTGCEWYVDGMMMGGDAIIEVDAPDNARELHLLLVAFNELCSDTLERRIQVAVDHLFVPNVFTPLLSTNSFFRAYGVGILEFEMDIYNREGLRVFHSESMEEVWDGTHDGKACPQASYVYRIHYRAETVPDGWQTTSGSVLLLR